MNKNIERIVNRRFRMTDNWRIDQVKDLYTTFSPNVDYEALCNSEFFPALEKMMEPVLDVPDEKSPEVMAYWAKRGMVKEYHGTEDTVDWNDYKEKYGYWWNAEKWQIKQNETNLWVSYVPVSAFQEESKDRKYPVLFAMHGACNNIGLLEGWGFVAEAAKREWIVIVPALELKPFVLDILEQAKKLYPVDESRVYVAGFSYGGWASNRLGNECPDVFAACAPCGAAMDNALCEGFEDDREPLPPFDGVHRAAALGTYMPIINVYGDCDGGRFPVYNFHGRPFGLSHMAEPKDILDGINHWAKVNKAKEIALEDVMALKDSTTCTEAEKEVGIPLAEGCGKTYYADGVRYHMADIPSEDGVVRTRILAEMNIPHWPTPEMVRQILEFFSHFSRNPETKESIYTA